MRFQKLFVAIPLPKEHHGIVLDSEGNFSTGKESGVRWVRPEHLHLTVKFLGEIENTRLHTACELMAKQCAELSAFEIAISGLGTFPPAKRPRVLWAGVTDGEEQLRVLHQRLDEAFLELGVPAEGRTFRPHLTLARIEKSADAEAVAEFVTQQTEATDFRFVAQKIVLFESEKVGRYYQYEPVAEVKLQS